MELNQFELRYDEYETWHESARKHFLEPARVTAVRLLDELLDAHVDAVDRGRFRISASRVKSAQRSFAKINGAKYRGKINSYSDVPSVLDDLVGVRLVCNNLSDINTFQEIVGELPLEGEGVQSLAVRRDSHRDYFSNPKPSGYRAYHVNIVVSVPGMNSNRRVEVEIQARTLLQDGWGELTHEDTYKPGSTVPQWIVGMSLRMAELLAAVDNIAQDLRTGLDVETQRSVLPTDSPSGEGDIAVIGAGAAEVVIPTPLDLVVRSGREGEVGIPAKTSSVEMRNALEKETKARVNSLKKPIPLAELSQTLMTVFGTDITKTWAQLGGFKNFLEATVPEAQVTGPAPGYLHPPGASIPDEWAFDTSEPADVPPIVRELRTYDKAIPLITAERMKQAVTAVGNVIRSADFAGQQGNTATASQVDALARLARSDAETRGQLVVRPHAVYILQALNRANRLTGDVADEEIRAILFEKVIGMGEANSLVSDRAAVGHELCEWLGIELS